MTSQELDRLEALARAATQGEWSAHEGVVRVLDGKTTWFSGTFICSSYLPRQNHNAPNDINDTHFIAAANPLTVLALIAALKDALAK